MRTQDVLISLQSVVSDITNDVTPMTSVPPLVDAVINAFIASLPWDVIEDGVTYDQVIYRNTQNQAFRSNMGYAPQAGDVIIAHLGAASGECISTIFQNLYAMQWYAENDARSKVIYFGSSAYDNLAALVRHDNPTANI